MKESKKELRHIRREYNKEKLEESFLPENPLELLASWLEQAQSSGHADPTAMTLSTVELNGQPSSRIVLLKKIQEGKLIFFTNYHSRKSREIRANSKVAAHFYWPGLERQVKIAGIASALDDADSDLYFQSRPFESNITAWASPQSEVVPHRQFLENEFKKYLQKFKANGTVPRPAYWGGYAITPTRMEFWQGGKHRLHDRFEYTRKEEHWSWIRLGP